MDERDYSFGETQFVSMHGGGNTVVWTVYFY